MRPIRRRLLLGFGGLAALIVGAGGGAGWLISRPDLVARGVEHLAGWPEGSIGIGALHVGRRVGVEQLSLHPPQARAPDVTIASIEADWPSPWALWEGVVDLGEVRAHRVEVVARTQAPPPPPRGGGITLRADRLVLTRGSYRAPEEAPFHAVSVGGVDAELVELRWQPRARRVDGIGTLRAATMDLGAIELDAIDVSALILEQGDLRLGETTFRYGRTYALAEGEVRSIDRRADVDIRVRLAGSRVETAVEDATGRASPLMGWLASEVTVRAGGDLPRGASHITGWVDLSDAHVFVGDSLKLIPRVLLDLAPWFEREDGGWLAVGDLRGEASFRRGWVELLRLERPSDRNRMLQAWGEVRDGTVDMTVRAVPKRDSDKAGVGVRLKGPVGQAKLQLARKDHLLTAPAVASW